MSPNPYDLTGPIGERELREGHDFVYETLMAEGGEFSLKRIIGILSRKYAISSGMPARIYLRMMALNDLLSDPHTRGWSFGREDDDAQIIDEVLVRVAASHPIEMETLSFEPQSFFDEVLRRSRHGGSA